MKGPAPKPPVLILVTGVAGSGKTVLAREIVRRLTAMHLDKDDLMDAFFPDVREGPEYEDMRPRLYRALYKIAEENLKLGNSVLLDAPHVKEMQREEWRVFIENLVLASGARLAVLRCLCSEATLWGRLERRGGRKDAWKLANRAEFLKSEPPDVFIPFPHLDINTEESLPENTDLALGYISAQTSHKPAL